MTLAVSRAIAPALICGCHTFALDEEVLALFARNDCQTVTVEGIFATGRDTVRCRKVTVGRAVPPFCYLAYP